MQGQVNTKS